MTIPDLLSSTKYKNELRQIFFTKGILVGNKTVDHSAVVGALPVDAAPNISSFST